MSLKLKFIPVIFLMVFAFIFQGYAQTNDKKQSKKEARAEKRKKQFEETQKLVNSKSFIFDAQRVFPTGTRSLDLTTNPGSIKIENDSAWVDLPFFGRSYTSHYDANYSMDFEGKIEDEKLEISEDKLNINYSFVVNANNDSYNIFMEIAYSGDCSVTINSQGKATISYSGKIEKIEKKDE